MFKIEILSVVYASPCVRYLATAQSRAGLSWLLKRRQTGQCLGGRLEMESCCWAGRIESSVLGLGGHSALAHGHTHTHTHRGTHSHNTLRRRGRMAVFLSSHRLPAFFFSVFSLSLSLSRSEERRGGKECRSRRSP